MGDDNQLGLALQQNKNKKDLSENCFSSTQM
jgi:hypothetical protein